MTSLQKVKKYISRKNARTFFSLLLITTGIWLILQLSKTYTTDAKVTLNIVDIPMEKLLESENLRLSYQIEASGFKLFWLDFKSNNIEIELENFNQKQNSLFLNTDKLKVILANKYSTDSTNIKFRKNMLSLSYTDKQSKYVKIKPDINYSFSSGYNSTNELRLLPDSIKISGSEDQIRKIESIKTNPYVFNNLKDTLRENIKLVNINQSISLSNKKITAFLPVQKFTEDEKKVDIKLINVPDSIQVNFFPKYVRINYLVPINKYNKVSNEQFQIICDFNKKYENEGIMIPKVKLKPYFIKNINMRPSKIEYLIKK